MNTQPVSVAVSVTTFSILCLFMLATRMEHFGSAFSLPDASLAAFFFAGYWLRGLLRSLAFPLLCALAVAIDWWVVSARGVSAFCITLAYVFLLPTYFVMWWAGRHTLQQSLRESRNDLKWLFTVWLAVSVAFVISSGSFYLFSGHVQLPGFYDYLEGAARYYPRYTAYSLGYILLGLILTYAFRLAVMRRVEA